MPSSLYHFSSHKRIGHANLPSLLQAYQGFLVCEVLSRRGRRFESSAYVPAQWIGRSSEGDDHQARQCSCFDSWTVCMIDCIEI